MYEACDLYNGLQLGVSIVAVFTGAFYKGWKDYNTCGGSSEPVKGESETGKGASKGDILSNKTLTNQTGKVDNYVSSVKGNVAAEADFNALNPTNVRTYPNGTVVGDLPDGRTVNLHPSSTLGGTPTVEIYDPSTGMSTKVRY